MTNKRTLYMTDAEYEALKALARRWGVTREVSGVKTPNLSATVVRAIWEALDDSEAPR